MIIPRLITQETYNSTSRSVRHLFSVFTYRTECWDSIMLHVKEAGIPNCDWLEINGKQVFQTVQHSRSRARWFEPPFENQWFSCDLRQMH